MDINPGLKYLCGETFRGSDLEDFILRLKKFQWKNRKKENVITVSIGEGYEGEEEIHLTAEGTYNKATTTKIIANKKKMLRGDYEHWRQVFEEDAEYVFYSNNLVQMGHHYIALNLNSQITAPDILEQIEVIKSNYSPECVFEIYPSGGKLDIYASREPTPEERQKELDDWRSKKYAEYLELKELVDKGEI